MEALTTYTEEKSLAQQMKDCLYELRMNKAEAAMQMGVSRTMLSQYLNGKYSSDPSTIESKIRVFIAQAKKYLGESSQPEQGAQAEQEATHFAKTASTSALLPQKVEYFHSMDFVSIIGLCQSCQEQRALGVIVGKSGYGKSHALRKYAELPRVARIECDDMMSCTDLVTAIETQLGIPRGYGGTIWSRVNRIREYFNVNDGYLLIIDEADKLINKYTTKKMEVLRSIFDQSRVGVVIAGELKLEAEVKGQLPRLANRIDFYYRLKGLSRTEVADYLKEFDIEDAAMDELATRAVNAQTGCFRLLDRTLNNVLRLIREQGTSKITVKAVSDASSMMML